MTPETLDYYLGLVTDQHSERPKFIATLTALVDAMVGMQQTTSGFIQDFDLDTAVGAQLDAIGLWVGISRVLQVPLVDVYFSFDIAGVGFDEGLIFGPYDPALGPVVLPDEPYRLLLKAKIARNTWDGTIPGAYEAYDILFDGTGFKVVISDQVPAPSLDFFSFDDPLRGFDSPAPIYGPGAGRMTMRIIYGLLADALPIDPITLALFSNAYLSLKPAGVQVEQYQVTSVAGAPLFGFDADNDSIGGFDHGAIGTIL